MQGLYQVFCSKPKLAEPIIDLLISQVSTFPGQVACLCGEVAFLYCIGNLLLNTVFYARKPNA